MADETMLIDPKCEAAALALARQLGIPNDAARDMIELSSIASSEIRFQMRAANCMRGVPQPSLFYAAQDVQRAVVSRDIEAMRRLHARLSSQILNYRKSANSVSSLSTDFFVIWASLSRYAKLLAHLLSLVPVANEEFEFERDCFCY